MTASVATVGYLPVLTLACSRVGKASASGAGPRDLIDRVPSLYDQLDVNLPSHALRQFA